METFLVEYGREARCKYCQAEFWWMRIQNQNMPLNADLSHHQCHGYTGRRPPIETPFPARTLSDDEIQERRDRQKTIGRRLYGRLR